MLRSNEAHMEELFPTGKEGCKGRVSSRICGF
jgi:hypothetical protein